MLVTARPPLALGAGFASNLCCPLIGSERGLPATGPWMDLKEQRDAGLPCPGDLLLPGLLVQSIRADGVPEHGPLTGANCAERSHSLLSLPSGAQEFSAGVNFQTLTRRPCQELRKKGGFSPMGIFGFALYCSKL